MRFSLQITTTSLVAKIDVLLSQGVTRFLLLVLEREFFAILLEILHDYKPIHHRRN
jgi:hypothetical protein